MIWPTFDTAAVKGADMLARRFSIVCFMVMLFGMGLSVLVAEASRPVRGLDIKAPSTCLFETSTFCNEITRS